MKNIVVINYSENLHKTTVLREWPQVENVIY